MRISDWNSNVCSSDLEDRGKFKLRVLEKLDDEIDMLFMFRGYMAQVSRVQFELRKQIKDLCDKARGDTQEAMTEFAEAQGDDDDDTLEHRAIGLTVVERSEERRVGKECDSTCRSRGTPIHTN